MRAAPVAGFLLLLTSCSSPRILKQYSDVPRVELCELLRQQPKHQGKLVRLSGTYRSGFELSSIDVEGCDQTAWVSFDKKIGETSQDSILRKVRTADRIHGIKVRMVGYLLPPNEPLLVGGKAFPMGFGHMNAFDFEFHVMAVEEAKD